MFISIHHKTLNDTDSDITNLHKRGIGKNEYNLKLKSLWKGRERSISRSGLTIPGEGGEDERTESASKLRQLLLDGGQQGMGIAEVTCLSSKCTMAQQKNNKALQTI